MFKVTSDLIYSVVPANQLLRPWDNVPRRALAQEIAANRLMFSNYVQGYDINSVAHSMTLVGPEKGTWSVKKIKVDFEVENTPPYSVEYSAVELDETTELNIWKDPPLETFDV